MKRLVVAVAVLLAIIAAGAVEAVYVDKVFDELAGRVSLLESAIKDPEDDAIGEVRSLTEWWEKRRHILELFTYSPDMRAFSVALAETEGSLECGDDKNALSKCQSLLTMAGNIHDMLDFNLQDIV